MYFSNSIKERWRIHCFLHKPGITNFPSKFRSRRSLLCRSALEDNRYFDINGNYLTLLTGNINMKKLYKILSQLLFNLSVAVRVPEKEINVCFKVC